MVAVTGVAQAVLYYATGVALFAWLSRVVENIPPLTGYTPRRSPREAIGWWFVPVASWVVPYQIVDDAIVRLRTSPARGRRAARHPWWITFLLMIASSSICRSWPKRSARDPRRHPRCLTVRVASDLVWVVGGVLLFLIVRAMEQRSEQRAAALALGRSAVATWPAASYPQLDPAPAWAMSERRLERVDVSPEGPAEPPPPPV